MVMIVAYVRSLRAPALLRTLHGRGIGVTAFLVHGLSGEKSTFLYSSHPFEPAHLPEAVKIEVVCNEESVDEVIALIAKEAKTGEPGDGIIATIKVDRCIRIRDM
jgi:nitrogen regulatory protein P-II 1